MKKVPFYGNLKDNMHCMPAVYGSLIEYFLHKQMSMPDLDGLVGFKPGIVAWTIGVLPKMTAMGFDVRMIEPFDYIKYSAQGKKYLNATFDKIQLDWYLKNSNILEMRDQIPKFLKHINFENRIATLADIDNFLLEDRLVFVTVNSAILNNESGFIAHAILVIDKQDGNYVVHDPGLPEQPNRIIIPGNLLEAMGGEQNNAEVTGFKLKERNTRADILVANMYRVYSRSALSKLFSEGLVKYNGKEIKPGTKVPASAKIIVDTSTLEVPAAEIDLPILYEDDDCVVINKPAGVLTHAAGKSNNEPTVATFLRDRLQDIEGQRGGIVHRLDRYTSGVLIGAKSSKSLAFLQKQFASRTVKKIYYAVVLGHLDPSEAIIDMPIQRNPKAPSTFRTGPNGKPATTRYKVVESGNKNDLVELRPETGRTHQLRVHLAKIGHPIIGDPLYGEGHHGDVLYLLAKSLEIDLPNGQHKIFSVPLPAQFKKIL